jgi:uncharacterized membrane protein YdjX (TVP38/TMEM64 family)
MGNESVSTSGQRKSKWHKPALAITVIIGLIVLGKIFPIAAYITEFMKWVEALGTWGPVALAVVYVIATVLFVPGLLLTMVAGFTFGLTKGFITISVGSTLGAAAAFLVGRYFARDWVEAKITTNPRFQAIDQAVGRQGWKIVGLTRLSPVFPFNLLNYAFGLTKVSFRDYFLASWIGMIPGTLMYVYIGSVAGDLTTLLSGERSKEPMEYALYGVGLIVTIGVTLMVTRIARRALDEAIDRPTSEENQERES